jgi:undecaprenyl-diphosphatase
MNSLVSMNTWAHWNVVLFQCLHATSDSPHFLISVAAWLAELPLFLTMAFAAWQVVRQRDGIAAVRLVLGCGCALLIEVIVSKYAYHPRPFAAGFGPSWVSHAANNSMPSTHATLIWTITMILASRQTWFVNALLAALGCAMAWARIYIGIHWPADMVGAVLSACLSTGVGYGFQQGGVLLLCRCRPTRAIG